MRRISARQLRVYNMWPQYLQAASAGMNFWFTYRINWGRLHTLPSISPGLVHIVRGCKKKGNR
jgi:hypothetical protein